MFGLICLIESLCLIKSSNERNRFEPIAGKPMYRFDTKTAQVCYAGPSTQGSDNLIDRALEQSEDQWPSCKNLR
jgi:hypothetical protein